MLEEKEKKEIKEITGMLLRMDETGLTIMSANATVLLARQELEKKKTA